MSNVRSVESNGNKLQARQQRRAPTSQKHQDSVQGGADVPLQGKGTARGEDRVTLSPEAIEIMMQARERAKNK